MTKKRRTKPETSRLPAAVLRVRVECDCLTRADPDVACTRKTFLVVSLWPDGHATFTFDQEGWRMGIDPCNGSSLDIECPRHVRETELM